MLSDLSANKKHSCNQGDIRMAKVNVQIKSNQRRAFKKEQILKLQ